MQGSQRLCKRLLARCQEKYPYVAMTNAIVRMDYAGESIEQEMSRDSANILSARALKLTGLSMIL